MMFTGCVIPPSLSVDETDAGLNAAPAIISVRSQDVELFEWSTLDVEQGSGELNLVVYDTDVGDTLQSKVYINYLASDPKPARSDCTDAAGDKVIRSSTCNLAGLCQAADVASKETLTMQVVVFDRTVVPGVPPLYQGMGDDRGLSTSRTFFVKCFPRST